MDLHFNYDTFNYSFSSADALMITYHLILVLLTTKRPHVPGMVRCINILVNFVTFFLVGCY